jgi:hypothetical protein
MNMPLSIPTDNLYKFVAVAGLITMLVSIVFPAGRYFDFDVSRAKLRADYDRAYFNMQVSQIVVDGIREIRSIRLSAPPTTQAADDMMDTWLKMARSELPQQINASAEMQTSLGVIKSLERSQEILVATGMVSFVIGLTAATWGFWKWSEIQRLSNIILQHQAATSLAESRERSAPIEGKEDGR